ncbi:Hypothetical protein PBC10988_37770 [Planctomycetales bacterium 10988]|nr:Hypothetical protein PBC10988_37770 [Planctomycetales bacterium 10988]
MIPQLLKSRWRAVLLLGLFWVGVSLTTPAAAQVLNPNISLQLPTYRFFTVQTNVVVPDSGGAYLGGIRRSSNGSTAFHPSMLGPGVRGRGQNRQAGGMQVEATIIDHQELDRQLLAETNDREMPEKEARSLKMQATRSSSESLTSVSAIEAKIAAEAKEKQQKAWQDYQRGLAALDQGKPKVAKIYWQMALRRAEGTLKNQIQRELASLAATTIPNPN